MKLKQINNEDNEYAAIGIGAMIVFIALILVAAVASAVIIQTGEKLQQNAQQTGDDTQREIGGKITINSAYINSGEVMRLYFESAPGSGILTTSKITWQIACTNTDAGALAAGYQFTASAFDSGNTNGIVGDTFLMTDPGPTTPASTNQQATVNPSEAYVIDIDVDGDNGAGGDDCTFAEVGINGEITLWIHVEGGGSTYEVILITNTAEGSLLI